MRLGQFSGLELGLEVDKFLTQDIDVLLVAVKMGSALPFYAEYQQGEGDRQYNDNRNNHGFVSSSASSARALL